jgi:D-threo-aldose 1-dehydrogenase
MPNRAQNIFKPKFKFGLGGVPLGNEFDKHSDKDAEATLEAAWAAGVRYYDVAPWYGFGLSERRFGHFLHNQNRDEYVLSSKVGKLFKASKNNGHAKIFPMSDSPNDLVIDYTADGVRRSIEDSLQRLGVSHLDIAFVHDLSPDFAYFPNGWEEQYEIALKGAFPALSKMRDEGIIRAWGVGVNTPYAILKVIEDADPDVCLCARQYSLIDHANALNQVFPAVRAKKVSLVIGSSLNAGFVSGSPRYNYGQKNFEIPADVIKKREQLRAVAARHGVDLRTAALQFSASASEAVALVVGARSDQQIQEDYNSMNAKIPGAFWDELKSDKLIEANAQVPAPGELVPG